MSRWEIAELIEKGFQRIPFFIQIEVSFTSPRERPTRGHYWWFPFPWVRAEQHGVWKTRAVGFEWLGILVGAGFAYRPLRSLIFRKDGSFILKDPDFIGHVEETVEKLAKGKNK